MIPILIVLFFLSAFFSSSETVLFSLTPAARLRIREKSRANDECIGRCLADQAVLFSTLLVGNTFVNFAIATLGYQVFAENLPAGGLLAVPVMTVLLLVFGEITPKRLALRYAETLAPAMARMLWFWRCIFTPFNSFLRLTSRAFAPALERERRVLSDAEFVSVIETAAESGTVSFRTVKMVEGVLRLSELCANDEMTPRVDIEGYDVDREEEAREQALKTAKHRFLPVFRRSADQIEGVIDRETREIGDALFVPETVTLDDLLKTFAKSHKPLAVVLDEYGGTAGIITPNDIWGLILGEGAVGFEGEEARAEAIEPNVWEIDARMSLDEINRILGLALEAEDADRLSGWVAFHAERVPHIGQEIVADGCKATVLKRRKHRVTRVRLEILARPKAASDETIIAATDEAIARTEEDLA